MTTYYRVYRKEDATPRYGKLLGNGSLSFKSSTYTAFKSYGEADTAITNTADPHDRVYVSDFGIETFRFCACGRAMERGYNYTCKVCSENRSSIAGGSF